MRLPVYKVLPKGNTEEQLQIQVSLNPKHSVKSAYKFMKNYDLDYDLEQLLSMISQEKLGRDIPISENIWDNLIIINGSYSVTKDGKTMEEIKPKKAADIYQHYSSRRLRQIEEYSKQMDDSWQKPIFIHSSVFNQFGFGINENVVLILDGARRIVAGCLRRDSFKDAHILMTSEYFGDNIIDNSAIAPSGLAWFPNYQTITEIGLEGKRSNKRYEYFDLSQFKDKIVFDFGCNLGQACIKIAIAGAEHVFGFDSQEDTLKTANKIIDKMGIENISYHEIDFNDRDFDRKIDAIVDGDADFSCFFSVYRTKELRQRERLFQYIIDKTKDKIFFEGHADPKIDTLEYYDELFKRFGLEYEFKGYSEGQIRPFFICKKKSLSGVTQLGTTVTISSPAEGVTKRCLRGREVLMTPSESMVGRAVASYRVRGFRGFVKSASIYLLQKCRILPRNKALIIRLNRLRDKKYIPTTTAINVEVTNICNCNCIFCAYSKITRNKGIMELKLFKNVIEQAVELKIDTFGLTPIVGEPLLDPSFLEKCDYLSNTQKVKNFYFFTNGILLNKVMFQKLQKYSKKLGIHVSLYGTTRDQFKELTGTDKFDTVMNNFESISSCNTDSENSIEISVGYRCGHINPEISNFMEEIRTKDGIKEQYSMRSFDTWGGMVDENVLKQHNLEPIPAPFQLGECSLPYYRWIVTWDGLVNACACRDADATLVIGDLKTESLNDILEGNTRKKLLRNMALGKFPPICRGCTHYRSVYLYHGIYKNRQLRSKNGQLITERY